MTVYAAHVCGLFYCSLHMQSMNCFNFARILWLILYALFPHGVSILPAMHAVAMYSGFCNVFHLPLSYMYHLCFSKITIVYETYSAFVLPTMWLTVYKQLNAYLLIYIEHVNLDYINYKLNNWPTTHNHSLQGKHYAKLHIYTLLEFKYP